MQGTDKAPWTVSPHEAKGRRLLSVPLDGVPTVPTYVREVLNTHGALNADQERDCDEAIAAARAELQKRRLERLRNGVDCGD